MTQQPYQTIRPSALLAAIALACIVSACAAGEDQTVCTEPSDAAVLEISNVSGTCELPAKLNLASLAADGCTVTHTASADQCTFSYVVKCEGVTYSVEAFAAADDDVRGTIHKDGTGCSSDADVRVTAPDPWR
jgi:hypothetical protein